MKASAALNLEKRIINPPMDLKYENRSYNETLRFAIT